jgi:hypothetical protein
MNRKARFWTKKGPRTPQSFRLFEFIAFLGPLIIRDSYFLRSTNRVRIFSALSLIQFHPLTLCSGGSVKKLIEARHCVRVICLIHYFMVVVIWLIFGMFAAANVLG